MPEKVTWLPNQRVDLDDLKVASADYTRDEFRHGLLTLFQGQEPGGTIWDGFYVEVSSVAAKTIRVWNGFALDRLAERVYKAPETTDDVDKLFDDQNVSKEIVLAGTSGTRYIEVEFVLRPGESDARSFWDPTFDNGSDPSGDPRPDGREIARNIPTRQFPDWKVRVNTTGFGYASDLGASEATIRIPIATIELTGGSIDVAKIFTETARGTVLATPSTDKKVRVSSARLLLTSDILSFYSSAGADRLNGAANSWPIASIDYVNNVVTLSDDPNTVVFATDSFQVSGSSSGTPKVFVEEWRGTGSPADGDRRNKFFSENEPTSIDTEAIVADYMGLTPATVTAVNSSTTAGPGAKSIADGPFRTDTHIKTLKDWVRGVEYIVSEMKHGVGFSATQDGSTDYTIESWVGTHVVAENGSDTDNVPVGSLGEVGNARLHYPLGSASNRVQHDTVREHLSAIRSHTITVGASGTEPGDFEGAQGLANAMQHIYDNHSTGFGTLYIKAGSYDLSTVTYTGLTDPLTLPKGWSLVGEFQGGVEIEVPYDRQFVINLGAGTGDKLGQRVSNITFLSQGTSDRTASMVTFVVDTTTVSVNGLGRPVAEIRNCTFLNENTITGAGTFRGMVRVAGTTGAVVARRVLSFRDCTFANGGSGQVTFEWSALDVDAVTVPNLGLPGCNFDGCTFLTLDDSVTNFGCYIDTGDAADENYQFTFRNSSFLGGGTQTALTGSNWIDVGGSTANVRVDVQSCTFSSIPSGGTKQGGGIFFNCDVGTLAVTGCVFKWLQWGIALGRGKEMISGCEFASCAAGVLVGNSFTTSRNKVDISGCTFTGEMTRAEKSLSDAKPAAQTIGVMVYRAIETQIYGTEDVINTAPRDATTIKISGCNFTEIGCGINLEALHDNMNNLTDNQALVEMLEVSGCNFYGIPGPAIDSGFINPAIEDDTIRRAAIGSMLVNGNTFQWCAHYIIPDIFTAAQSAAFPVTEIDYSNQNCVGTCAHRVFITNNTFNAIGFSGYSNDTGPYDYTGSSSRRFLAVMGNDPHVATRTVVVKGNTFVGFSNQGSSAVDPWDLTLTSDVTTQGTKEQSWAGCFWVAELEAVDRDDGVQITIANNTISGDHRTGASGNFPVKASDGIGHNGFYIDGTYDFISTGTLKFTGNDFFMHQGQHGLYVAGSSSPGTGRISFNEILIQNNSMKSLSSGTSPLYKGGYPLTASSGRIELVRLANWNCNALYAIDSDGVIDGPQTTADNITTPAIHVTGNFFHAEGIAPAAPLGTDLLKGKRAGVLMAIGDSPNAPNAVFHGNTFKNCSLTFGEDTDLGAIAYKYVVTNNVFAGHLPNNSGDAGYFRGLFCHNHVHGEHESGGDYLANDRVSVLVFSGNTVHNGTAALRAGNSNNSKWGARDIGYVLQLINNVFYGRGGGLNDGASGGGSTEDRTVKACFDFLGGHITTQGDQTDDLTAPTSGTNLETWGANDDYDNKVIFVALNAFPANVGENNCLVAGNNTVKLRNNLTLAGPGTHYAAASSGGSPTILGAVMGGDDTTFDQDGFVIAANMQMMMDEGGASDPNTFNISGSQ